MRDETKKRDEGEVEYMRKEQTHVSKAEVKYGGEGAECSVLDEWGRIDQTPGKWWDVVSQVAASGALGAKLSCAGPDYSDRCLSL